jgi:hypothetical protein
MSDDVFTYLRARPDRCDGCGRHPTAQKCVCAGLRAKERGQAIAAAAHPDERARVDAAIRHLAATGRPFSSNTARPLHGVNGPVVGAAFTAARKAGLIQPVGYEPSNEPGTHAHPVRTWLGVAA